MAYRSTLNKDLFLAARGKVVPQMRDNEDEVKAVRSQAIYEATTHSRGAKKAFYDYKKASDAEVVWAIAYLRGTLQDFATPDQLKLLKFLAISCGIHYCRLHPCADNDGNLIPEEQLRTVLKNEFLQKKNLEKEIIKQLYREWINPQSHEFLEEGDFKTQTETPSVCYYHELKKSEVEYLIKRFRAMREVIYGQSTELFS